MTVRFFARSLRLAVVLASIVAVAPALAQDGPKGPPVKQKKLPEAPAKLPKVDRSKNLDFLFGALAGLGMIMQEIGDEKRALDAYRKALAINPHLDKIPDQVKSLTEKVEGLDI
ncbi:MAG: tetratricopeptide repeat protein [Bradyrhizobium guangdongense]